MTTSESFRKDVADKIDRILKSSDANASIAFPNCLSAEERKYVHHVAEQFGLKHVSKGKGDGRHIIVERDPQKMQRRNLGGAASGENPAPHLSLSQEAVEVLDHPLVAHAAEIGNVDLLMEGAPLCAVDASEVVQLLGSKAIGRHQAQGADHHFENGPPQTPLLNTRMSLPVWKSREEILRTVREHQVTIVVGETGCGKSTQIPQFVIEESAAANVIVTQPRRISALGLACRVAQERGEPCGNAVGYAVHLDTTSSEATRLLFCTTGILRRRLLADPQLQNVSHLVLDELHEREKVADFLLIALRDLLRLRPALRLILMSATMQHDTFRRYFPGSGEVSVTGRTYPVKEMFLDDFAPRLHKAGYWKALGPGFAAGGLGFGSWNDKGYEKTFKYQVLVSHAHDQDGLCGFSYNAKWPLENDRFNEALFLHDVLQQTKGVMFDLPIIESLLLSLATESRGPHALIKQNSATGGILVFLPGWDDIDRLRRRLRTNSVLGDQRRFLILPLHSQVRLEQQREVFKRPALGVRKIVLSTNIAETSITIDDIEVVLDCGRVKETSYDPFVGVPTLNTSWISQASMRQRAGRAGRTAPGVCYHLFARPRACMLDDHRPPEILRASLEDVYLHAKLLLTRQGSTDTSVGDYLRQAPDPPENRSVQNAESLLREMGAVTQSDCAINQLTALGTHLSALPLSPQFAKIILWANFLGVGDSALTIVASLQYREPFVTIGDAQQATSLAQMNQAVRAAKTFLSNPLCSDHIALMRASECFEQARARGGDAARVFCESHSLSFKQMQSVRETCTRLRKELRGRGFWSENGSRNSNDIALICASLCAGLFPNIACRPSGKRLKMQVSSGRLEALPHPSSVASITAKGSDLWKHWHNMASPPANDDGHHGAPSPTSESWLCFNELNQIEDHYSLSGITTVPVSAILLLCGEGKLILRNLDGSLLSEEQTHPNDEECAYSVAETAFDLWWSESNPKEALGASSSQSLVAPESVSESCGKDDVLVSLDELGDWLVVRASRQMAARLQALRAMVLFLFRIFCSKPDQWHTIASPGRVGAHVLDLASQMVRAETGSTANPTFDTRLPSEKNIGRESQSTELEPQTETLSSCAAMPAIANHQLSREDKMRRDSKRQASSEKGCVLNHVVEEHPSRAQQMCQKPKKKFNKISPEDPSSGFAEHLENSSCTGKVITKSSLACAHPGRGNEHMPASSTFRKNDYFQSTQVESTSHGDAAAAAVRAEKPPADRKSHANCWPKDRGDTLARQSKNSLSTNAPSFKPASSTHENAGSMSAGARSFYVSSSTARAADNSAKQTGRSRKLIGNKTNKTDLSSGNGHPSDSLCEPRSFYPSPHFVSRCDHCQNVVGASMGAIDENDGLWYCLCCWDSYIS